MGLYLNNRDTKKLKNIVQKAIKIKYTPDISIDSGFSNFPQILISTFRIVK